MRRDDAVRNATTMRSNRGPHSKIMERIVLSVLSRRAQKLIFLKGVQWSAKCRKECKCTLYANEQL